MRLDNNDLRAFLALLQAGLWGGQRPVQGSSTSEATKSMTRFKVQDSVDWEKVYQLAQEQSVVGLALQGIDWFKVQGSKFNILQVLLLQWIGEVQVIEQRNRAMNAFIAELFGRLREAGIDAILVKGQGVAQCYEKPLWRVSGDVDLLLSDENYQKAKDLLIPLSEVTESEDVAKKHLALKLNGFDVELHGRMPFGISCRADNVVDEVISDSLLKGGVSKWSVDDTDVFLPNPDNHILIVFTHFLHHFFIEGVGLRQICDWCRLLYTYKDTLNYGLLESRIRKMGLMTEWKAFGALAVKYLGMNPGYVPFLGSMFNVQCSMLSKKADRILESVLECGNFGHNKDLSYRSRYSGMTYKIVAAWRRLKDFASLIPVFPLDAPRFYVTYLMGKVR